MRSFTVIEAELKYLHIRLSLNFISASWRIGIYYYPYGAQYCLCRLVQHIKHIQLHFYIQRLCVPYLMVYSTFTLMSDMTKVPAFIVLYWPFHESYSAVDRANPDFAMVSEYFLRR